MSTPRGLNKLHLPSLSIKGFRGIADLSIPRLGRVSLIAGNNGVGKTTLLEAVRVYAERGSYPVLSSILKSREEVLTILDEDGDQRTLPDLVALAYGRHVSKDTHLSIGPVHDKSSVNIEFGPALWHQGAALDESALDDEPMLTIKFRGIEEEIFPRDFLSSYRLRSSISGTRKRITQRKLLDPIYCGSVGPNVMDNDSMARLWDAVALTEFETRAVQALRFVYGDEVDRVTMVADENRALSQRNQRRAVVKIEGQERPVPLKSLGDGAVRIFGTALAIANSSGGVFVIDEAENGIHHSVQPDFWRMVLAAAFEYNVQVLATTHSWDCVVGFSKAASELETVDGMLIRVDRMGESIRTVQYSEAELQVVARQGIEVR